MSAGTEALKAIVADGETIARALTMGKIESKTDAAHQEWKRLQKRWDELVGAARTALSAAPAQQAGAPLPLAPIALESKWLWRHKKSGGTYEVIGTANLQSDTPLSDMAKVEVYRGADGALWVRAAQEFKDRFERFAPRPQQATLPASEATGYAKQETVGAGSVIWFACPQDGSILRDARGVGRRFKSETAALAALAATRAQPQADAAAPAAKKEGRP